MICCVSGTLKMRACDSLWRFCICPNWTRRFSVLNSMLIRRKADPPSVCLQAVKTL